MSAPAGWHLQPDGQERYWDGTRWTDEFRAPLPSDPTAPPADPSWSSSVDETQALDVNSTQAIPAPAAPEQPAWGADPTQQGQAQPAYHPPVQDQAQPAQQGYGYPATGYGAPQTGYGAPGGQPYAPPPQQGSGLAKGCLIAALVGVLVVGAGIVVAIYAFSRTVETVSNNLPSGFPTDLPTDFPTDVPTEGLGEAVDISVGDGFELPRANVLSGWSLEAQGSGIPIVNVVGMKADISSGEGFPVLFTMSFPDSAGAQVETVCTAASGSSGATVDVSCVPFFGDVADATEGTVTASL